MRTAWAALTLGSLLVRSAPATACGESPSPRYEVSSMSPTGVDAVLNAPITLQLLEVERMNGTEPPPFLPTLALVPHGKEGVAVTLVASGSFTSFVPAEPLLPNMDYDVVFKTGQELAQPGEAVDPPPAIAWTFTTGAEQAPTLSLEGELSVTFEAGEDPAIGSDCNSCGCAPSGEMLHVTKARVRLPRVVGGFEPRRGQLFLTDDVPETFGTASKGEPEPPAHNVYLGGFAALTGDAGQEMLITVPDESTPYVPCFAFQAYDARDDRAIAEPLCLHAQAQGGIPNDGTSQPDSAGPQTSASCSIDRGSSSPSAWLPAALLLGLLSRRRRSRSAL